MKRSLAFLQDFSAEAYKSRKSEPTVVDVLALLAASAPVHAKGKYGLARPDTGLG